MAHTDEKKKWTMRDIITYVILGIGGLLVLGGIAWLVYSNMDKGGKSVQFKTPPVDSILVTTKKST